MSYTELLKDPRWQKKRLKIMERDNWTCRFCNDTDKTLNVHHIDYVDNPWDAGDDLLLTLCEPCHKFETELLRDNKAFKILAKRSGVAATEWATLLVVVMNAKKDGYDCRAIVDECTKTYRSLSEKVNSNG